MLHYWLGDQVGVLAIYRLTTPGEPEHNSVRKRKTENSPKEHNWLGMREINDLCALPAD